MLRTEALAPDSQLAASQAANSGAAVLAEEPSAHSRGTGDHKARPVHFGRILRNIFSTWVGYLATLVVGFLLAPYVVHHLGNTGYGIWTLVVSLTGYFGMLDLGLRQSVGRFVARFIALEDVENVNRTISSAIALLACAGLLALLATALLYFNFHAFKIESQLQGSARTALLIAGLNISIALPMSVFGTVLTSLERFDVMTAITLTSALVRATLVTLFLHFGTGVVTLALITLASSAAEYISLALWARHLYPALRVSWRLLDIGRCRELFGFGIFRFIWIVSNQLIFYTDSVVIGAFLSAAAITYYTIAGSLINYGRNMVSLAADTLYPSASRLDAKKDFAGLRELQIFGTKMSLLISLPLCAGFFFLGRQFISLWMGESYASSAVYLTVLTIPQLVSMSQYISALILVGMAKHRFLALVALIEGLANLGLSIFLVRRIGLVGVAWGTAIPHLLTSAIVLPLYILRTIDLGLLQYLRRAFVSPLLCALPAAAICYLYSMFVPRASWLGFAAEAATVGIVSAAMSYFFGLTAEQQMLIRSKLPGRGRVALIA